MFAWDRIWAVVGVFFVGALVGFVFSVLMRTVFSDRNTCRNADLANEIARMRIFWLASTHELETLKTEIEALRERIHEEPA